MRGREGTLPGAQRLPRLLSKWLLGDAEVHIHLCSQPSAPLADYEAKLRKETQAISDSPTGRLLLSVFYFFGD